MKKIPVVKQRDFKDCGPCSILSILKYYDGYVPIEKIRLDCYTNINGTTAYHMVNALKKYGFDAYGATIEKENFNSKLVVPFIAHLLLDNGMNHYVVVYDINSKTVKVMDPYKGIVKLTKENFSNNFTKVAIFCYPRSTCITKEEKSSIFKFIINIIKNYKKLFSKILLLGFLNVIFTIAATFYFKISFNNLDNISNIKIISLFYFIIFMSKEVFEYLSTYYKNYLIKSMDYNLNREFFNKIFYLPSRIVKNRNIGEIITRVRELNNLHEIISDVIITLIIDSFLAIISFIVLYFINSKLLLILLFFTFLFIIICIITNKLIYKMIRKNIESNEQFNDSVVENCNAFESIKNNNIEAYTLDKLDDNTVNYIKTNFCIISTMNIINNIKNLTIDLMYYFLITLGIYLIIKNKLTLISFITFESILVYLIDPIRNIMNLFPKLNYLKASLEKIVEFLDLPSEKLENEESITFGDISISNLSYSYNDYHNILSNINVIIKKGSHVMIRGKSGVGKSTLCKLLNRTYEYTNGEIKIGNINIKDIPLKTLRNNILYLSQNEFLFNDTIKNNIILDKEFDLEKFQKISEICNLEEIINKKALRYETFIDKDFSNLSGGEKQRIILARALYHDFEILILDESLSEVNLNLEINIISNLKKYLVNKTMIYVTHKKHEKLFDYVIDI